MRALEGVEQPPLTAVHCHVVIDGELSFVAVNPPSPELASMAVRLAAIFEGWKLRDVTIL